MSFSFQAADLVFANKPTLDFLPSFSSTFRNNAMLRIINVVGARPNFMKIAPVIDEMRRRR